SGLVRAGARIVGRRDDIGDSAGCVGAHHDVSTLLLRASFQPIDVSAVEAQLGQGNGLRDDEVRCDRRFPGAVRRSLGRGGRHGSIAFYRRTPKTPHGYRRARPEVASIRQRSSGWRHLAGRGRGAATQRNPRSRLTYWAGGGEQRFNHIMPFVMRLRIYSSTQPDVIDALLLARL